MDEIINTTKQQKRKKKKKENKRNGQLKLNRLMNVYGKTRGWTRKGRTDI